MQALAQQPGMGWITQLQNDPQLGGKIDWAKVEEAHRQWNHDQQGLTPEGAVIVTLVVAFFTAGAASGVGAAAGETAAVGAGEGVALSGGGAFLTGTGLTISGVVGGAVTAGISALASEAAIALINNQGDIGGALHDLGSSANVHNLLTAIVTGGVLGGLQMNPTGLPTAGGGVQGFGAQLGQNLTAGAARAVINTAINGGSLEGNLQAALKGAILDTVAAQAANAIGTATFGSDAVLNEFTNKVAHAIAGCAVGAARAGGTGSAGGCAAGALGAAIGELAAETYGRNPDTVQFAAMMSAIAVAIAGGDAGQINLGSQAGGNAAANNFLSHQNVDQLQAKLAKCTTGDDVCITAAIESMRGISQANDALLLNCKATNNCAELASAYRQGSGDLSALISAGALGGDSNVNRAFSLETPGFIDIANGLHNRIAAGCNLANPSGACIQQSKDFAKGLATAGVGLVTIPLAFVGAATTGAVAAGVLSALTQTIDNGSADAGQVLVDAATGAITGVLVNGLFQGVSQVVVAAGSRVAQLLNSEGELVAVMPASRAGARANNFYGDGSIADPSRPMSASGPWRSVAELTPRQANAMVTAELPEGSAVTTTRSANAANAAIVRANPSWQPSFMPGTQIVEFTTTAPSEFVRVSGGDSRPTANWIMKAQDIAGLSPEQIASKFALPAVPTQFGNVTIPAGTRLEASVANGILLGNNAGGGGVQFYIAIERRSLPDTWFGNVRPLNGN